MQGSRRKLEGSTRVVALSSEAHPATMILYSRDGVYKSDQKDQRFK
jgi:hypothetical protein